MSLDKTIISHMSAGIITIVCGIAILVIVLVTQYFTVADMVSSNNNIITLTEDKIKMLNNAALPTFLIILFSLLLSIAGILMILRVWQEQFSQASVTTVGDTFVSSNTEKLRRRHIIAVAFGNTLSKKVFWIAALTYFIVFSLSSNTIVYRPGSSFSNSYGVTIPSFHIIGCCGQPGSFPVLSLYVTDELGLLLIPSNVIIATFLSLLVGINFSIITYRFMLYTNYRNLTCSTGEQKKRIRKRMNLLSVFGLGIGLFAGCPACAGSILLSIFFGTSTTILAAAGSSSTVATVGPYQPLFIAISFIMLVLAPIFMIRA